MKANYLHSLRHRPIPRVHMVYAFIRPLRSERCEGYFQLDVLVSSLRRGTLDMITIVIRKRYCYAFLSVVLNRIGVMAYFTKEQLACVQQDRKCFVVCSIDS